MQLWVEEAGGNVAGGAGDDSRVIRFSFTEASTGLCREVAADHFELARDSADLTAGFIAQGLNRPVAQSLLSGSVSTLVVAGVYGCTVDLPRLAAFFEVPVVWVLNHPLPDPGNLPDSARTWLTTALRSCSVLITLTPDAVASIAPWEASLSGVERADATALTNSVAALAAAAPTGQRRRFDYAIYEFCQRDHPLLVSMQSADTVHFEGCRSVLDLGCGVGIFLDCLQRQGVNATGVERDPVIAAYGRGMGLDIETEDALAFLAASEPRFDGVYCSHFVEHLPFEGVQQLLAGIARVLQPGGVAVFAFPDPESIRSQLLGFWRDPEHVRFYHPDLIAALAFTEGLELEWSSHQAQPHRIVPFAEEPGAVSQPLPLPPLALPDRPPGLWARLLAALGLATRAELASQRQAAQDWSEQLRHSLARQQEAGLQLQERTERLWEVNRTWAWDDNATLRLRKRID